LDGLEEEREDKRLENEDVRPDEDKFGREE